MLQRTLLAKYKSVMPMCVPQITLKVGKYCKSKIASGAMKLFKEERDEIKGHIVMAAQTVNTRAHLLSLKVY